MIGALVGVAACGFALFVIALCVLHARSADCCCRDDHSSLHCPEHGHE